VRVLQVTEAAGAGTLRIVEVLSAGLARAGCEVTVAHGRRPETPPTLGSEAAAGVDVVPLDWDRRTPAAQLRALRQLRRLVSRTQPDVVHLHSTFAGLVGAALGSSPPRVYTPHGWASSYRDWRYQQVVGSALDRLVVRRCDLVGVVSEVEAEAARQLGARRITVVPNGVPELDAVEPVTRSGPKADLVVAGGRLVASRRPAEAGRILRAVQDVAETRWIGGGGSADLADDLHAAGIAVTGWLPHAEALDQLGGAVAYLHWSAFDAQSVAVLEAMARDVVVIASDIPANRELLSPAQLFSTEEGAAAMLRRVVRDPDLRRELVAAQRARGAAHGAERMVQGWVDAYRHAIGADAEPARG